MVPFAKKVVGLLIVVALVGCGGSDKPKLAPVTGVVTLDGQPIEGAAVMFMPTAGGRPAHGSTDAHGRFELMTFKTGDGALVGEHRVSVTKMKLSGVTTTDDGLSGTTDPTAIKQEWLTPEKYASPETSGLTATVKKGMDELKFDLVKE
jgi:hypothetical protein